MRVAAREAESRASRDRHAVRGFGDRAGCRQRRRRAPHAVDPAAPAPRRANARRPAATHTDRARLITAESLTGSFRPRILRALLPHERAVRSTLDLALQTRRLVSLLALATLSGTTAGALQ